LHYSCKSRPVFILFRVPLQNRQKSVRKKGNACHFRRIPAFSIINNRTLLATPIPKCRSAQGSAVGCTRHTILLKTTVRLRPTQVKIRAYTHYAGITKNLKSICARSNATGRIWNS
jgi:hypothetical protein